MSSKKERPTGLFTFVQVMGVLAMGIAALCACMVGGAMLTGEQIGVTALCLLGTPLCLLWLLAEFVCMCGRVKKETAFTTANVRALGRIVLAFVIGGVLLIPAGGLLMEWLMGGLRGVGYPLLAALPTFAAFTAALLIRAIQLLLRRAVEMQSEQDLTV